MRGDLYPEAEFAYGSGHINPLGAVNPGLIYNASETDYIRFLCDEGYNTTFLRIITKDNSTCSTTQSIRVYDLNYPSFALFTHISTPFSQTSKRRVTNVGSTNSTYKATISAPSGLNITVNPSILSFKALEEELNFEVTFEGKIDRSIESASLVWDDGVHKVRSPIIVFDSDTFTRN